MTAVLITGAAQRIGRALAIGFATAGYDIYGHYNTSAANAQGLIDEIKLLGRECRLVAADLSDPASASSLIGKCQGLGPVCHLVNNAAIYEDDPAEGFSAPLFDRQMAINLRAPLILADAFRRQAPEGGTILSLLDSRVDALPSRYLSYMMTKTGLLAATEMLALKYAPHIRVNAIAPGPVLPSTNEPPDNIRRYQQRTPLAMPIETQDIVEAACYLLHAMSVTGQILYIDGGQRFTARRSY